MFGLCARIQKHAYGQTDFFFPKTTFFSLLAKLKSFLDKLAKMFSQNTIGYLIYFNHMCV